MFYKTELRLIKLNYVIKIDIENEKNRCPKTHKTKWIKTSKYQLYHWYISTRLFFGKYKEKLTSLLN